jgi:uncharacterized protein (UPF0335 family)
MALDAPERLDSKPDTGKTGTSKPETGGIAGEHLRAFVDRIERLEEEKRALSSDIKDIYAEAKGSGFDVKILRKLISVRRLEAQEREEMDELLTLYMHAIGM